jgi:putative chitinase
MLTLEILQQLWPNGNQRVAGLLEGVAAAAPDVFPRYGLNDDLTIAHAMAQFSVECGGGVAMVENLNYSAQGLLATWPSRFNADNVNDYARNPQKIADMVYGGRMGNAPPPSDDGWNYRGRGLSQLTGRANYQALTDKFGLNVVDNPDLPLDPARALEIGVATFVNCGCLPHAQADDVTGVTKALNGGLIGFADRQAWLAKWKTALGVDADADSSGS